MDTEIVNLIKSLFDEYANKNSAAVTAAYLTVGGMLFVSVVGVISQWFITKHVVSEEQKRLLIQLHTEARARQHEKWEADIIDCVMGLLKATDPEINKNIDPTVVTTHVLKVQLLLNTDDHDRKRSTNPI
ncbi:MAG: hypothetical protein L3J89_14650 [Gammaproteobacteria bacterium]|nr:hypothetical protein [Gammaproteobacteria bacterium]